MEREVSLEDMYGFIVEGLSWSAEELALLIPEYREKLNGRVSEKVKELDREVISRVDNLPPYWEDDETKPLERWWWHLRKIARGEYPAELLPSYLREIYLRRR